MAGTSFDAMNTIFCCRLLSIILPAAMLVAGSLAPVIGRGQEPAAKWNPPWGGVDASAERLGRYVFRVERRPEDGRVAVPAGFPQIVRATLAAGDDGREPSTEGQPPEQGTAGRDVAIELNADATAVAILLPPGKEGPAAVNVAVETAEETRQFDDGRIVLTARDARVEGSKAKLEEHPSNYRIGFWTSAEDAVAWTRKLTRWGMYDVILTYSSAAPDGSEIEVTVGETKLVGRLASTGSWYRYATLPLGRVSIPTAGDLAVRIRGTKMTGGALMNLKAITLAPACEGTPPVQADDGVITLHGRDATVLGTNLRYEPAEKKQTLGFWTRATDAATWTFTIRKPGEFTVEVLQGCGTGQGGSEMLVEVDWGRSPPGPALGFTVEDTGGFQAFRPREIGRVRLEEPGRHQLRVALKKIAKGAAGDIRQIRLVPVAP